MEMVSFGLVSLLNGISTFMGYLTSKPCRRTAVVLINPLLAEGKRVPTFPEDIGPKVNIIT